MRTPETYPLEGELEDIEARLSYLDFWGFIHRNRKGQSGGAQNGYLAATIDLSCP